MPFSVGRHFFNLHPERSDMAGAIDNKPQRIECPERHSQLRLREHVEDSRQRAKDKIGFVAGRGVSREANTNDLRAIEEGGARVGILHIGKILAGRRPEPPPEG